MDDWKNVQDILNNIYNLVDHLSSDKDKQLVNQWKIQIFESLLHELNESNSQTKHTHKH